MVEFKFSGTRQIHDDELPLAMTTAANGYTKLTETDFNRVIDAALQNSENEIHGIVADKNYRLTHVMQDGETGEKKEREIYLIIKGNNSHIVGFIDEEGNYFIDSDTITLFNDTFADKIQV